MRFLANENIPPSAVRHLRDLGHDVFSVKESMAGHADEAILARAVTEQRVLLTFDKDFGELAFRRQLPVTAESSFSVSLTATVRATWRKW